MKDKARQRTKKGKIESKPCRLMAFSAVLLRIKLDGEELRPKVSTRRIDLGILCLVVTSNVVQLSQRLCCNGLLRNKFFVIMLLSL